MSSGKAHLLLVDDDPSALILHAGWLGDAGFEVTTAESSDDAVLLAREYSIDLAVLDITMSGRTGLDVARHFRKYSSIPFIFLSAARDGALGAAADTQGALGYLAKPVDRAQLLGVVRQALTQTKDPMQKSGESGTRPEHPHMRDVYLAAGVLMVLDRIDRDRALMVLASRAREQRRTLRDTAQDILDVVERVATKPSQDFAPEVTQKLDPRPDLKSEASLPTQTIAGDPNPVPDLDFVK